MHQCNTHIMLKSIPKALGARRVGYWLKRFWFRGLLFLIFIYALQKKEISIHYRSTEPRPVGTALSLGTGSLPERKIVSPEEWKPKQPSSEGPERQRWRARLNYLQEHAVLARSEMQRFGIPASITLAQGLLESGAGSSLLATKNNNHFGIKCFSKTCKQGHCSNFSDDSHKDFFRVYASAQESYRAHSKLLSSDRYQNLKNLGKTDYVRWAEGLQKAGYATDPSYAKKIIQLIEDFELYYFDRD